MNKKIFRLSTLFISVYFITLSSSYGQSISKDPYDIYINQRAACLSKITDMDTGQCLEIAQKNYEQKLESIYDTPIEQQKADFCYGTIGADKNICELQRAILENPYSKNPIIILPWRPYY